MNGVLKPRLPWLAAALMTGAILAAVFTVAPAHASQAPNRPALALNSVAHADSNGVINPDGIQGSGAHGAERQLVARTRII
jgi:hypothetical protein